jgi:TrmH family RNA methyltransferase
LITSSQNPRIKLARALMGRPKERRENLAFIAEGVRLVEDAFSAGWPFRFVLYSEGLSERGLDLVQRLSSDHVDVEETSATLFQSITETETPQGIVAVLELNYLPVPDNSTFILIPDQIRDPGNLGTLLRTAAAAGADAVIIPPETADPFAPKVVRAGMGAHFRLPVQVEGWDEIHARVLGMDVHLADAGGDVSCWDADFQSRTVLIVGGEAAGASGEARKLANKTISIPMPGKMESMNAGVAGAILMFEVVRQRQKKST